MRLIPYARQFIAESDISATVRCLKSDFLTQGPRVKAFEEAIADYCGAKFAVAVNSGTSALHIACIAAGLKSGDEGITSPITFAASANCMLYCGAKPVFADILEENACIDPGQVAKKINRKTKVVIPVHFSGQPCDMNKIRKITTNNGIAVIEDACHALGAKYGGYRIGSCKYSDMAVLSFHPAKHITTGEGGMVLTNNRGLFEKLNILRSHGMEKEQSRFKYASCGGWYHEMHALGYNYRITDIQCALGSSQLKKLSMFLDRRRRIASIYDKEFSSISSIKVLKNTKNSDSARHLYIIRVNKKIRKAFFDGYKKRGIFAQVHYIPVYRHPYYQDIGYSGISCLNAEKFYSECITLPLYPAMTKNDIMRVIDATLYLATRYGGSP